MNERLIKCMARALEYPADHINKQTDQTNIGNWDSIHHMRLIVEIERTFDISVPDDMVGNLISYSLIETFINEHTA